MAKKCHNYYDIFSYGFPMVLLWSPIGAHCFGQSWVSCGNLLRTSVFQHPIADFRLSATRLVEPGRVQGWESVC